MSHMQSAQAHLPSHDLRIFCSSSLLTSTFKLPTFSSRRAALVVPGIGKMSSPCAINHAKVNWLGVTPLAFATSVICSTSLRFLGKFSALKRGANRRKSLSSKSSGPLRAPLSIPRFRGE
ncbi:aldo/keto reductase [Alternaria sp. MG1]|nr:aldo/keto reductase [Alternaria sp. MG1]